MGERAPEPMRPWALIASGLALVAAVAVYLWVAPGRPAARLTNLDLERSGFRDLYLMHSRSEPDRCFVVRRRASTLRRDDDKQPGRKWRCESFAIDGAEADAWLVRSKRIGKGTVFFVPADAVPDWSFPYLYGFVREVRPDAELPAVDWVQLHVDRIYQGLYLRMALPFDKRKKDGGSGVLREVLVVEGDRMFAFDTRFREARGVFTAAVASGRFPERPSAVPALAWLARRAPGEQASFLIAPGDPPRLSRLPLPVSLERLHRARRGREPAHFSDARFAAWRPDPRQAEDADPFTPAEREALIEGYREYEAELRDALRLDRALRGEDAGIVRIADRSRAAELTRSLRPGATQ